ncbi:MetQ/NlpA family ABC transporter substrate-binding protein [Streptomyces boncukensis]|uniref:MetQ/NlpA family ABC transporter substrate-binding protein n=1 Tax=Streptomyces boncukensis TaxID=2711219 RepID=UPI0030BA08A8
MPLALIGYGLASGDDDEQTLRVAASPTPHAEILEYVDKHLAGKADLKLDIRKFNDYVVPNTATESGEVDANFFQHKPYLDDFNKKKNTHIVPVVNVELEPLGLYSKKADSLKELTAGKTVAVPNDSTNEGRALHLLADSGLIELERGAGPEATLQDIADARGLKFKELEAASVPRALGDVDAAVINGNYAVDTGLNPSKDALASEKVKGNPYANFLAVKDGHQDDPRVRKLAGLLNSPELKKFIERKYQGAIAPAFGPVRG